MRVNGRDVWLGKYGSPESRELYNQLVARWLVGGPDAIDPDRRAPTVYVVDVTQSFRVWSEGYHLDREARASKAHFNVKGVCRRLRELYGTLPADEFQPGHLMIIRDSWVRDGLTVTTVNEKVRIAVRAFKHAVAHGLVPETIWRALTAVEPLKAGKCAARRPKKVKPVPEAVLRTTLEHMAPILESMVRVHLLTGMRSSELCSMTPGAIDASGRVWLYRPEHHKTEEHGHDRIVAIGPKAQAIIAPFLLDRAPGKPIFSPAEAEAIRRAEQHAARTTPLTYGNRPGTNRRTAPKRQPGYAYDSSSYRRAVWRACDQAFPPPEHLARREGETERAWLARLTDEQRSELEAWRKAHRWHPHQLRHNAATRIRREHGLEAAQALLGHASMDVTELYAERNLALASAVAMKAG
jgi:integrase